MSGTDYTLTPNYGLFKPVPGMDADVWGGHWNQNADKLDTTMKGFLPLAGGTMLGDLILNRDPTLALGAATKQYVDNTFITPATGDARWVNVTGDTMTGDLILNANPTIALQAATKSYVDTNTITPAAGDARWVNTTGDTMTGPLSIVNSLAINAAAGSWSSLTMTRVSGQGAQIAGYTGSNPRWAMTLCDATVEGGGNAGSNFNISRFDDAGNYLGSPLSITRSTGVVNIAQALGVGGALTVNGLVGVNNNILAQNGGGNAFIGSHHVGNSAVGMWNANNVLYFGNADAAGVAQAPQRAYLDAGGSLNISGNLVSQGYIMNAGGVMYVAGNYNYYMGRDNTNGLWRIVDNGNVLSSMDANGAMTFAGTVMAGGGIYPDNSGQWTLYNDGNSNRVFRWQGGYLHSWSATSGALSYFVPLGNQWYFPNDGSGINWIAWVGGVGPYRDVSDERTKTDIAPAGHGLDAVLALQPILFRRWFQGKKDYADRVELGFGARQVRDVLPEAVTEVARSPRQWDAPGTPVSGDPILAVALTPIVAAVVNAVKTLHARLDVIETKGAA